jgi:hypothetical protein
MNKELTRMWKYVAVVYFKVLYWIFPGITEENQEIPQDSWCPG